MTDEQFSELIAYLDAMNEVLVKILNYQVLSFIVLSLLGGIYIGGKIAK